MRVLNMQEVEYVSGAGFFSSIGGGFLGFVAGAIGGIAKGAAIGGAQGGILGVGAITGLVGTIVAGAFCAVGGTVYGLTNGWDQTRGYFNAMVEQIFDLITPVPR